MPRGIQSCMHASLLQSVLRRLLDRDKIAVRFGCCYTVSMRTAVHFARRVGFCGRAFYFCFEDEPWQLNS
jgi:hypothetical protein